jgi:metal-responsive CopG/Arc/MetJ family transcriptional regulator
MSHIKTAVSIDEGLLDGAKTLTGRLSASRSDVFSQALQDFIRKRESQELFENYNEVYAEPDPETERVLAHIRAQQRKALKGQWK